VATGVAATIGIAFASGFAAVYTEKVIKSQQKHSIASFDRAKYSLAYMQVQLASMSLLVMGAYALVKDFDQIKVCAQARLQMLFRYDLNQVEHPSH